MTTTVTKESLAARIAELESGARSLKEDYTLAAYKMLLATMEAEPVMCNAAAALRACLPEFHEDFRDIVEECEDIAENACRAAMLHAEPVMTPNKLPEAQFKQVADLYEMQFDDGRTCAFHTDAEKAVQWLNTCDGNKVQEYVKLERLHDAVSGNSPVIPDKWIPVSERVPEEGGRYWCYVEEQNSLGKSHYQWNCSWNGDVWSDKALTGRVTHWMPLPAGPVK